MIGLGGWVALQIVVWFTRTPGYWEVYLSVPLVCFGVAAYSRGVVRRWARPALAAITLGVAALLALPQLDIDRSTWSSFVYRLWLVAFNEPISKDPFSFADVVPVAGLTAIVLLAVTAVAWLLGVGFRAWLLHRYGEGVLTKTRQELRDAELDLVVNQERERISQDVHDIMAHSLSVIIAQADGARFLGSRRPEATDESLVTIAASARSSLTEVRRLIESLGPAPEDHVSSSADLEGLFDRMRSAGLAVTVETFGQRHEADGSLHLTAYRVLQESLTNALRHGGGKPSARVTLSWRPDGLSLTVASTGDGAAVRHDDAPRQGRGITGMKERVARAGGWLTAEMDEEEARYVVTASIPTGERPLADSSTTAASAPR